MDVQTIPFHRINAAPYNPRIDLKPDDDRYTKIVKSLDEFGLVEPLVWNRRTGHLVGGHQRLKVLQARGETDAHVSIVDLPLDKEKALNLALNKTGGDWDKNKLTDLLADMLEQHDALEFDFEATGFDIPETEQLLNSVADNDGADEGFDLKAAANDDSPSVTQPGELIELGLHGEHRLLCGDALDHIAISRLFGTELATLCVTDPPYGVSYDPKRRNKQTASTTPGERFSQLRNDDLTEKRYRAWFEDVAAALDRCLSPGSAYYIWNAHTQFGLMSDLLRERGFKISAVISWVKESFNPGFSDYNEHCELCLYGWKGGARHRWYGPKNESTLWRINRDNTRKYVHPTQKSLELAKRAIRNSSRRDEIVFDPFLGGGTTLIASALLGRRCFGIEIEPKFCDVIVRRYIAAAGRGAVSDEIASRYLSTKGASS